MPCRAVGSLGDQPSADGTDGGAHPTAKPPRSEAGSRDLIAPRHAVARDQPSSFFTMPLALARSSWPACFSLSAAMTLPMSLTLPAPTAAITCLTVASSSVSDLCLY